MNLRCHELLGACVAYHKHFIGGLVKELSSYIEVYQSHVRHILL